MDARAACADHVGQADAPHLPQPTRTERWDTPDGDFLDVVRLAPPMPRVGDPARAPRLLLLHGLEGGLQSHYVHGLFAEARGAGGGWT